MPDWPEIPQNVVEGVQERWPDRASRWLATAGETLAELCASYNGRPRDALHARYGYVVTVDTPDGRLVIRSSPDPDGPTQVKVSDALAALGVAPAIHQTIVTDVATWTVMDEIQPGTPFALTDRAAADLEALAAPLANLHKHASQPHGSSRTLFEDALGALASKGARRCSVHAGSDAPSRPVPT